MNKLPKSKRWTADGQQRANSLVKIGAAAKKLGISKDTLRRWEAAGKITSVRTDAGYRLYDLKDITPKFRNKKTSSETTPKTPKEYAVKPNTPSTLIKDAQGFEAKNVQTPEPSVISAYKSK